jgi:aminopeptidase-like protein
MFTETLKKISEAFSGGAAKSDVAEIIRHHRIQASPGYRAAADYVLAELKRASVSARMETYPASYQANFWATHSFQEWEANEATLQLIQPEDEARKLADYREMKLSLIQRSAPFSGEVEVVVLEDGLSQQEYEGLDVQGKVVLTRGQPAVVQQLAVEAHGAVGILFDGMSRALPVREASDLPDERQYTSFWWTGAEDEKPCFGFVLTPRQGGWLRGLIRGQEAAGADPVRLRAEVDTHFYDGNLEIINAVIPGQTAEEIVLVSHLCHPQPSANDNASGAAANLEAARTLQTLISRGDLPQPRRSIRFLWLPEMSGSYAYLSRHEDEIPNMIAGLNLDMVGADQDQTGSVLLTERPPESNPSYTADLLDYLRDMVMNDVSSGNGKDHYSLFRYATTSFSGGSDHYIFSDPSVGVPMPMLIQWPDKFYHTSADTLDKVSKESLARAGTISASYAYFIANAASPEVHWLAHEMLARFRHRLTQVAQRAISAMVTNPDVSSIEASMAMVDRQVAFWLDRHRVALQRLIRLANGAQSLSDVLYYDAARFAKQENSRVIRFGEKLLGNKAGRQAESEQELDSWEQKAADMVPNRLHRGPADAFGHMQGLTPAERQAWQQLLGSRPDGARTMVVLAEYWADNRRTALEIIDLIELEMGVRDAELIVRRFEMLAQMGLLKNYSS